MENLINAIIQTILETDQIFYELTRDKRNLGKEIPNVEIDINCRETAQVVKIYTSLLLAVKIMFPLKKEDQRQINQILKEIDPQLKAGVLELAVKNKHKHLFAEYLLDTFPTLKLKQ